jgi:dynein heavy chain, axonemal
MPGPDIVRSIYHQMINGHLQAFEPDVARMSGKLTDATIELHKTVMNNFLPSSVKFHYQFNLREMSNITQARPDWRCAVLHARLHVPCVWSHNVSHVAAAATAFAWPCVRVHGCHCDSISWQRCSARAAGA